jgi:hypothetical protein
MMWLIVICVALTGAPRSPALVHVGAGQQMPSLSRLLILLTGRTDLLAFAAPACAKKKAD